MRRAPESQVAGRTPAGATLAAEIAAELARLRRRTVQIVAPLDDADLRRQIRRFMSPLAWDLGHIADFERLWLVDAVEGRAEGGLEDRFDALDTPREERCNVALPGKDDALDALECVRRDTLALLERIDFATADPLVRDGFVYRMVLQHEAQHQETMLQALDLPDEDWGHPDAVPSDAAGQGVPADSPTAPAAVSAAIDDEERVTIPEGPCSLGTDDRTRAYDNERSRHEVHVDAFRIERYPVTNRRWMRFVEEGGYRRPELWSEGGKAWLQESEADGPQGWERNGDEWHVRRFGQRLPLDPREPVQHVCFWEAEAFAAACGGRLPSEAEWEKAAAWGPERRRPRTYRTYPWGEEAPTASGIPSPAAVEDVDLVDRAVGAGPLRSWGPPPVGARPHEASARGVEDLLGSVYQWTASPFEPYPDFEPFPYREYSAVFFGDRYRVLRGSSWAADLVLWRTSYRNWDLPQRRQIFAGVRVAYDA